MPVFLFHGENTEKVRKETNKWINAYLEKHNDGINLSIYKDDLDIGVILSECQTPPFLDDKRLIIIFGAYKKLEDNEYKKLIKKIPDFPESTILLLVEPEPIQKNAKIITDIGKLGEVKMFPVVVSELEKDFQTIISKEDKTINPNLLRQLIEKLGKNPQKIHNEATKLVLGSQKNEISEQDIRNLVRFNSQVNIFDMMDNLSRKNKKNTLEDFLNLVESGEELPMILYMMVRQIRILIQIKSLAEQGLNSNEIATQSGIKPFVIMKTINQTKNFSFKKLMELFEKIKQTDLKIKSGKIEYSKAHPFTLQFEIEKILIEATQ